MTELFASKCKIKDNSEVMLIKKQIFRMPITTHIDIKKVSKNVKTSIIIKKIQTINSVSKGTKKAKIGILGLNPHNGELKNNSEEKICNSD